MTFLRGLEFDKILDYFNQSAVKQQPPKKRTKKTHWKKGLGVVVVVSDSFFNQLINALQGCVL